MHTRYTTVHTAIHMRLFVSAGWHLAHVAYPQYLSSWSLQADGDRDNSHQYYKSAATKLKNAVQHINAEKDSEFVLNLGDIIDGNASLEATVQDLETVASEFDKCVRCTLAEVLHASSVTQHHAGPVLQCTESAVLNSFCRSNDLACLCSRF